MKVLTTKVTQALKTMNQRWLGTAPTKPSIGEADNISTPTI